MIKIPELSCCGMTDIGFGRSNNEDVWASLPEIGFYAVADGMGGHRAGEIAAKETIDFLCDYAKKIKSRDCMELMIELRYAIEKVNRRIYQMGRASQLLRGMGTTLCCLFWTDEVIVYAHVGDSRIYRLRGGLLELLTQDHSLFARLKTAHKPSSTPFPYKNVITRSIGNPDKANPEIAIAAHQPGDLYLLCTDGISDALSLEDAQTILTTKLNIEQQAKKLIQTAKFKGSCDNMTLLIVQSKAQSGQSLPR